ncbi:MAG: histidine kinase [Bacteroidota bacterium]
MPKYPWVRDFSSTSDLILGMGLSMLLIYAVALTNAFLLVPHLFQKGRFGWYAPSVIVLTMGSAYLMGGIHMWMVKVETFQTLLPPLPGVFSYPDRPWKLLLMTTSFLPILTIMFVSLVYRAVVYYISKEKQAHAFREAQLQSELKLLRTQINPHFLFNTLNNLYALVQTRPALVEDLLLRFGDILRFVTYESHQEQIPLSQELAYIENYIHLQRVKDEEFTDIQLRIEGQIDLIQLEPMLLIPFVENAFKHSYRENSTERWIHIHIAVRSAGLHARIANNLPEKSPASPDQQGGVGLRNVRQRLQLRYPEAHSLELRTFSDHYQVDLWLNPTTFQS